MAAQPKRLKIGLVIDDSLDKPDGVQQYVLTVGRWLGAQGHEVHYLTGESRRTDIANLHSLSRNLNVRFNRNRMSMPLPASKTKLKAFLDEQRFDVLHVQLPHSPWLAHRLVLLAGAQTAIIGTFHIAAYSALVRHGTRLLGGWTRASIKRFDEIVAVSTAAQELADQAFGVKAQVLPNAFDYDRFHKARPLPAYRDKLSILFVGRLVPRKGCLILLRALNLLESDKLSDYQALICGKGPLEAKLKAYVTEHGLGDKVKFVGFVSEEDKPRYYASADISVFPSTGGESFGIVLLEAMAGGHAAVVAGDNSGYRTVMRERPELLVAPNRPDLLAETISQLMRDAADRQRLAAWGSQHSRQFDASVVGRRLEAIYYRALRKHIS